MVKNKAAVRMAKNWRAYLNRKLGRDQYTRKVRKYAKFVAEKMLERGFKNGAHRLEVARLRAEASNFTKERAASQIQKVWTGFLSHKGNQGRWTQMYLGRKRERREKLDIRKEKWSEKMIILAEAEFKSLKMLKEVRENKSFLNDFEKKLKDDALDEERESIKRAVEEEEKIRTQRMKKIDMLEEKIHHTIGRTPFATQLREKVSPIPEKSRNWGVL